jgi:hypothetical protein
LVKYYFLHIICALIIANAAVGGRLRAEIHRYFMGIAKIASSGTLLEKHLPSAGPHVRRETDRPRGKSRKLDPGA